jgi:tetratricopeptide (TPR) repeat protein
VKPSSLSEYIRAVYKLSSEGPFKQTEQRESVFSQFPHLVELAGRVERDATDVAARSQLVSAYIDHQLYWDAYHLLTESQSDDAETDLNLATIWDAWAQFELALKYGNRAIVKGASSAQAYELMGRINLHRREPAEAIDWYKRAAKQGENATILANLGFAHMLHSDWENAKINLQRAIELDEALPEPHNNLAMVLTKLGDEKGAILELLKTATSPIAFNNMGVLYMQEGKFDRARQFFEQALRLEPRYELAQSNLKTIEALMPPPTIVALPSFESAPIPNVVCPPPEDVAAPTVTTDNPPSIPDHTSFVGPTGIVGMVAREQELHPSAAQSQVPAATGFEDSPAADNRQHVESVSQAPHSAKLSTNEGVAVTSPILIEQKETSPEPQAKLKDKHETAAAAPERACMYSDQQPENNPKSFSSTLRLENPRLTCGILGLLMGVFVVVRRSSH